LATAPDGKTETKQVLSGYLFSVDDQWLWITAGHIIDGDENSLCAAVRGGYTIRLNFGSFANDYGWQAFPPRLMCNLLPQGVDCCALPLAAPMRDSLKSEGKLAHTDFQWFAPISEDDHFYIVGVPLEAVKPRGQRRLITLPIENEVSIRCVEVYECRCPDDNFTLPAVEDANKHGIPLFFARINQESQTRSIRGMSGGQIIRARHFEALKGIGYGLFAMQSGWFKNDRVIYGPFAATFMPMIRNWVREKMLRPLA